MILKGQARDKAFLLFSIQPDHFLDQLRTEKGEGEEKVSSKRALSERISSDTKFTRYWLFPKDICNQ
jgi:hypothetical protein